MRLSHQVDMKELTEKVISIEAMNQNFKQEMRQLTDFV